MSYRSLENMFHMDRTNERFTRYEELAEQRRMADASFRTGIETDCGELFVAVPRELSVLNENVLRYERKISGLANGLPDVAFGALVRDLIINEVVSTNELEGVHSTRKQIHDVLEMSRESPEETRAKRFGELAGLYVNLTEPGQVMPRTPQDIRSIYDQVMLGEDLGDDAPDGELFRRKEVAVYNESGIAIHEGFYPEGRIRQAIERMLEFVSSEDVPQVYSSIAAHFIFEFIHPFYDGNGRTGRYLLALWLSEPLSLLTSLSLSRVIFENKDSYYRAFKKAEHPLMHGELTFFVMTMLEFVRIAQDELESNLTHSRTKLDEAGEKLNHLEGRIGLEAEEAKLLYMMSQVKLFASIPEVRLPELSDYIGLSLQTTRKYTKMLESRGLVRVTTRSPLRFVLTESACDAIGLLDR